jgi:hypothetical protein
MERRAALAVLAVAAAAAACSGGDVTVQPPERGVPPVTSFDPDVKAWRGGCFFEGPAGKVVNGSPSPDVRLYGHACDGTPQGVGGLVYLDRYDPVAGTGDVTLLSSAPGSRPVVVGKNGGAGGVIRGGTGARLNDAQTKLLTLSEVGFVTGTLQLVDLAALRATPLSASATSVRVENYDFLPDDAVLYVDGYDASKREGTLVFQASPASAPLVVAGQASRFDFVMYRLAPDRRRVAYIEALTPTGGTLSVQTLPPGAPPAPIATSVTGMAWTADGAPRLVYVTMNADGATSDVWSWNPEDGSRAPLGTQAVSVAISGGDVLFATGWTVLAQQATLHVVPASGAAADALGAASVSRSFAASRAPGGLLAYASVTTADPSTGTLFLARLGGAAVAPVQVEGGVSPSAGFSFSPSAAFAAYAKGFDAPTSAGSANPQPGIARLLRFASAAGSAFDLAAGASLEHIAWDPAPGEPLVAAIGAFDPGRDAGDLLVRRTADGVAPGPEPLARAVSATWFDFADDGSALFAIRGWDGALERGELVVVPTAGTEAWQPQVLPDGSGAGATSFSVRGGRALYGVRGAAHDGLWLAPAAPP